MTYKILPWSEHQAKRLNVIIVSSQRKGKKITVIDPTDMEEIAHIGAIGYGDYPTHWKVHGKEYADQRRKAFRSRTASMPMWRFYKGKRRRSPSFLAREILW